MIEPHNAYTVLRRPLMPPKPAPKVIPMPKLSIWEDAKRIRKRHGQPVEYAKPDIESLTEKQASYRARQAARTEETRQSILDALARPATAGDVATRINRDEHMIRRQLVMMAGLGLVEGIKCKNVSVWHRKGEA